MVQEKSEQYTAFYSRLSQYFVNKICKSKSRVPTLNSTWNSRILKSTKLLITVLMPLPLTVNDQCVTNRQLKHIVMGDTDQCSLLSSHFHCHCKSSEASTQNMKMLKTARKLQPKFWKFPAPGGIPRPPPTISMLTFTGGIFALVILYFILNLKFGCSFLKVESSLVGVKKYLFCINWLHFAPVTCDSF